MNKLGSAASPQMQSSNNNSTTLDTHMNNTLIARGPFNTTDDRSLAEINEYYSGNPKTTQMQQ